MKFLIMISIVAVGAFTSNAQYFQAYGRVYTRQDIAHNYFLGKYIATKRFYTAPVSREVIQSPIIMQKFQGYQSLQLSTSSIDRANQHYRERPWKQMYLRPLLDLAYSLYEPRYAPTGN